MADYTERNLSFKIKKALRYTRPYGVRRTLNIIQEQRVIAPFFRDHGHDANMRESYEMVRPKAEPNPGCDVSYVWETGS